MQKLKVRNIEKGVKPDSGEGQFGQIQSLLKWLQFK